MNIQEIKQKYGLATDSGTNIVGFFVLVLGIINDLPDVEWKKYLVTLAIFGIVASLWLIKGSGLKHSEGEVIRKEVIKELPNDISDEELLDEGRK
jgi:hypothetical protein